jgi:hypothetical protein
MCLEGACPPAVAMTNVIGWPVFVIVAMVIVYLIVRPPRV